MNYQEKLRQQKRIELAATRREFLKGLAAAGAAALVAGEPRLLRADSVGEKLVHPVPSTLR